MGFLSDLFSKKAPEDPEITVLTECTDDVEAELVLGILRENGIPCMAKDKRAGSAARLYTGFSLAGIAVYVRREDEERAKELLAVIRSAAEAEETVSDADLPEGEEDAGKEEPSDGE